MNWKIFCLSMTGASALAFGLHALIGLNFWICLVMVVSGMLLNGYLAASEDDWPGGFNNPHHSTGDTQRRVAEGAERVLRKVFRRRR